MTGWNFLLLYALVGAVMIGPHGWLGALFGFGCGIAALLVVDGIEWLVRRLRRRP